MAVRDHLARLWLGVLSLTTFAARPCKCSVRSSSRGATTSFGWFPFLGYYSHTTFETLSHVIELMLLYFPLGFWMGQSDHSPGPGDAWLARWPLTFAIAAPIEYLQGWVVGRYPDVSDVAVEPLGRVARGPGWTRQERNPPEITVKKSALQRTIGSAR